MMYISKDKISSKKQYLFELCTQHQFLSCNCPHCWLPMQQILLLLSVFDLLPQPEECLIYISNHHHSIFHCLLSVIQNVPMAVSWKVCWSGNMNGKVPRRKRPTGRSRFSSSSVFTLFCTVIVTITFLPQLQIFFSFSAAFTSI